MASRIRTHLLLHALNDFENSQSAWNNSTWQPRVDVYEMTDSIVILVEAPGLQVDNLKLQFEPGTLQVEGVRVHPQLPATARAALVEMVYGTFKRRFALPPNADGDGISATYDAGILQITVPRREVAPPRPIQIEVR